ncbi:MAG: hypothetical protein D6707_00455 [Bacteroidetes bacterium]|nr:MAG: hypothetical protein D6707_00455 [Bacteroidota bacterium]
MRKLVLSIVLLLSIASVPTLFAGNNNNDFKKKFAEATGYLYDKDYVDALPILLELHEMQPDNANINFQIGLCYFNSFLPKEKEKSVAYFEEAVKMVSPDYKEADYKETYAPVDAWLYLGDAYHHFYKFDKAKEAYQKYLSYFSPEDEEIKKFIDHKLQVCDNAKELVAAPIAMKIENLGKTVNSEFADYSPVTNADESVLIFTSRRSNSTGGELAEDGKYYEDIYISENVNGSWTEPRSIGENINTNDHEATVGISADGQQLLIYKFVDGSGDLFISRLIGDTWSEPEKLGSNINTKAYESNASLSADGNYLYFTSDREGGFGGLDIYVCKKMPDGSWSLARNLGPVINSPYDESAVFMHPDGKTLFFSSKGHKTMGGFDIFFSTMNDDGTWTEPQNFGYPVNTTDDDAFFFPTADGKRAYYASFKEDGYGDLDIYMLTFPEKEEASLTVYAGYVKGKDGNVPKGVMISVFDNESGELIGEYTPNSATGKYIIILPTGRNYNIVYEAPGCFYHSENIYVPAGTAYSKVEKAIELDPFEVGEIVRLNNIFFDYDKATLKPESTTELEQLVELMEKCPSLKIEISGHTDSKGSEEYNLKLSQARTETIVKYLVERGVDPNRLVAKGYGESKPVAPNTNPDGSDNPEGRALNRRVEFKVLAI